MTILYALLVLLVAVLVTTFTSLSDHTIIIHLIMANCIFVVGIGVLGVFAHKVALTVRKCVPLISLKLMKNVALLALILYLLLTKANLGEKFMLYLNED